MSGRNKRKTAILGYIGFLALVAVTVTAAIMIYVAVQARFEGDKTAIALIMLAVCLCLSLICVTIDFLRRKFTVDRAVEEILDATEAITAGNFNIRLIPSHSYGKYDDFDLIKENLNQMAEELSKTEVLKTDFVSNVSHEIKTPLAIISNYASALKKGNLTDEQRREYVETISKASARLGSLVANVLKLNKLENQKIVPPMQVVRLDGMLAETIFDFDDLIAQKGIELECDFDEISINSSPTHLEVIWNNLLSNAIKFTPSGGKISVYVKKDGDSASVQVADTGIGMSEETGKHIFDKFYQGDRSHSAEGNGLGLALVKKTIDVLGGKIHVESELGKGTTFTVTLNGVCDRV